MFDTEAFILQVQNQPSIWDNSIEKYNDRDERLIAWETIAKSMFGDNLSSTEKIAKKDDLKKKWRNLRDNYTKYMTQTNKQKSAKKRYMYADYLSFLPPVSKKRRTKEHASSLQEDDTLNGIGENIKEVNRIEVTNEQSEQVDQPLVSTPAKPPTSHSSQKKNNGNSNFQDSLLEILRNNWKPNSDIIDPDQAFFLSFLPFIKKFNDNQKLELRSQFLKSICSISNYSLETSPIQYQQSQFNNLPIITMIDQQPINQKNCHSPESSSTQSSIELKPNLSQLYE